MDDRISYAIRILGRNAARAPALGPNATDAERIKWLLGRQEENDQIDAQERRRRSAQVAMRALQQSQRAMMRSGGSINSAYGSFDDAFGRGW